MVAIAVKKPVFMSTEYRAELLLYQSVAHSFVCIPVERQSHNGGASHEIEDLRGRPGRTVDAVQRRRIATGREEVARNAVHVPVAIKRQVHEV